MKSITLKHKFYAAAAIPAAAVLTTLPYFTDMTQNLVTYGSAFALLCTPAFLLFTSKMRQLHEIDRQLESSSEQAVLSSLSLGGIHQ